MMDFTTILQIKLALSLMLLIAVYFICIPLDKGIELFKHCTRKEQIQTHLILSTKK